MPKKSGPKRRREPGVGPEPATPNTPRSEPSAIGAEPKPAASSLEVTWRHGNQERWEPERIKPQPWNPRKPFTPEQRARLKRGLEFFGMAGGLNVRAEDGVLIGGHKRYEILCELITEHLDDPAWLEKRNLVGGTIPVNPIIGMPDKVAMALNVMLNNREAQGEFHMPALSELVSYLDSEGFDATLTGYDDEALKDILTWAPPAAPGSGDEEEEKKSLVEKFGVPPFTVFDSRQGYWQDRKRAWGAIGIASEQGRSDGLLADAELMRQINNGTSIFDPVLCELVYRWFCPKGGKILDPFAGGSVRGIVAALLGRPYIGIDLSAKQVEANRRQAAEIVKPPHPMPQWIVGNSYDIVDLAGAHGPFDLVFSCPPYYNLEQYSDDKKDISNAETYDQFLSAYRTIVAECAKLLAEDRFAVFVVGEIRDDNGHYRGFVGDTVNAWCDAGLMYYYNEAVLLTAVGTLPVRAGRIFEATRKLGKTHQNVLTFEKILSHVKGDAKKATENVGAVEFGDPQKAAEEEAALATPPEEQRENAAERL
jgi:DNA modification methylase